MRARSLHRATTEENDDVVDPDGPGYRRGYRRGGNVFETMRKQLEPAVEELIAWEKSHA